MIRPLLLAAAMSCAGAAFACGHCIEDRVAAVYDYAVEQRAERDQLSIAYLGVTGRRAESTAAAATVAKALDEIPAAIVGTVRTSVSPSAASFAWRGDDAALRDAVRGANDRLAASGLQVELLKTWDRRRGLH